MIDKLNRINLLSEDTSNKIAAGEVVERPASAVKELIENSIDAGAKNISISIEDGGETSIIVSDDGKGIHPEDIRLAFVPHATSKIIDINDIYNITSLGFRGEALASIASVSKVSLKSRKPEFVEGKEIIIEGGNIVDFKDVGCSIGTTIEIRGLFFNVPARQKFLKSSKREAAIISDMILKIALSHSEIAFKYISNGKQVFSTSGNGDLLENIRVLYGKEVYKNVTFFEGHSDVVSVYGYIGNADISRGSRNRQSIFVNKRSINSKLITAAIENAFKSFLTVNKFPFFTILIDIYPEFVDVNVHPTKSEIKFKDERFIFKFIFDSVHHALKDSLKNSFNVTLSENKFENIYLKNHNEESTNERIQEKMDLGTDTMALESLQNNSIYYKGSKEDIFKAPKETKSSIEDEQQNLSYNTNYKAINEELTTIPIEVKKSKFPEVKIIGQFNNSYILGEAFKELYIIDQHAAHEKILFERYMEEIKNREVISQVLAFPQVQELSQEDYALYYENKEVFFNTGFNIEPFGENTISIREVPIFLGETDVNNLFNDILEDLKNMGKGEKEQVRYLKIATLACKAAVKANHNLSIEEMSHLLNELRFIDQPFTCPHGRPTIIKYTLKEVEKVFKRIQ
ncbi:DNA mismatch repair endonuclease MutL [Hathewaya histolytica]|uniref:DNA mismatch repair protein MutL n=1 Tax=Hathewaya histolytica TaxID=1498 RepID=A0A4U9RC68_HATHI|nr:DNA mismatch repair endonuclease MutL [Hathewaya histolytica]VTQ89335.1 DNA mismatch repair protein [Hathewaya histolytica]